MFVDALKKPIKTHVLTEQSSRNRLFMISMVSLWPLLHQKVQHKIHSRSMNM